jgi:hypothetical protein
MTRKKIKKITLACLRFLSYLAFFQPEADQNGSILA